jgi:hypothetical protein
MVTSLGRLRGDEWGKMKVSLMGRKSVRLAVELVIYWGNWLA